jgi:hypothetical protein
MLTEWYTSYLGLRDLWITPKKDNLDYITVDNSPVPQQSDSPSYIYTIDVFQFITNVLRIEQNKYNLSYPLVDNSPTPQQPNNPIYIATIDGDRLITWVQRSKQYITFDDYSIASVLLHLLSQQTIQQIINVDTLRQVVMQNMSIVNTDTLRKTTKIETIGSDTKRQVVVQNISIVNPDTLRIVIRDETVLADILRRVAIPESVNTDTNRRISEIELFDLDTLRGISVTEATLADTFRQTVDSEQVEVDTRRETLVLVVIDADTLRKVTTSVYIIIETIDLLGEINPVFGLLGEVYYISKLLGEVNPVTDLQAVFDIDTKLLGEVNPVTDLQAVFDIDTELGGGVKMAKENQNFEMYSGDTRYVNVTVLMPDGTSLIGASAIWVLVKGSNTILTKTVGAGITITSVNTCQIDIDPADTTGLSGSYSHELEITDVDNHVSTTTTGTVLIKKDLI